MVAWTVISDSLVRVDPLVGLLAIEEVRHKFDDTGDTSGATNEDDFGDVRLVNFRVEKDLLNELEGAVEEILTELLETCTTERSVEVNTLEEGVDLNGRLRGRGKGLLGTLASSAETTKSAGIRRQTIFVLELKLLDEVVDETVCGS